VLIATPGRLLDHFGRGRVMLMGVEILVIDEADRMLDMGFIPDIEKICKLLPPKRQTLFFSATMPPEITRLAAQFLTDPERIEVAPPATTAKTITQRFRFCRESEDWAKREALRELIRSENVKNAIIFCNRKRDVAILHKSLAKHGFNAGALHGDMDQRARMETLDKFRSGEIMLLAASDVAARGLDIPDVSHVFNFDMPWDSDDYVHRIGRTGRAGKEGTACSIVTPEDLKIFKAVEKIAGQVAIWVGEPPAEGDFAEGGRRKRRGGRGAERGADRRGGGRGERREAGDAERGERPRREPRREASRGGRDQQRGERPERSEQPQRPERAERRLPAMQARATPDLPAPPIDGSLPHAPRERRRESHQPQPAQAQSQPRERRDGGQRQQPSHRGGAVGFADNVPAFLRKPPRPAKVASE
jgi:superfamily II DNA/RNA helicase